MPSPRLLALDTALAIALITAWAFGGISVFLARDPIYLSTSIVAVGLVFYILGHWQSRWNDLGMDTTIALGLLGTMIGFLMIPVDSPDLYAKLTGATVAFLTTATGVVMALLLRYQRVIGGGQ